MSPGAAAYRIELQNAHASRRATFELCPQPVSREAEGQTQHPDLTLPTLQSGHILTVRMDPGPTGKATGDLTYVSALR